MSRTSPVTGNPRTLVAFVFERDGVVPVSVLGRAGFSRWAIRTAVDAGVIRRVARGWVALPDADPYLVAAARRGVVLTCVTQAKRLGLWVLEHDRTHVGARAHSGRAGSVNPGATVHWSQPPMPRHPDSLVDPIENVLTMVATCQPFEHALVIWESAFQQHQAHPIELGRLDLPPAARKLLAEADMYSDSGLETLFATRLKWLGLPMRQQTWIEGHRVDLLIGDRLVIQIDGKTHVGEQREQDIAHDAALTLLGYHVIRVGYRVIVEEWPTFQSIVMRAVAQGLHLARVRP